MDRSIENDQRHRDGNPKYRLIEDEKFGWKTIRDRDSIPKKEQLSIRLCGFARRMIAHSSSSRASRTVTVACQH